MYRISHLIASHTIYYNNMTTDVLYNVLHACTSIHRIHILPLYVEYILYYSLYYSIYYVTIHITCDVT